MMGGIGFTVGLIGFLLYTMIGIFAAMKYNAVRCASIPLHACLAFDAGQHHIVVAIALLAALRHDLHC